MRAREAAIGSFTLPLARKTHARRSLLLLSLSLLSPASQAFSPPALLARSPNSAQGLRGLRGSGAMATKKPWEREIPNGSLFKYGDGGAHVAFYSGPPDAQRILVLLGGLTDGLLPTPYTVPLGEILSRLGWGMVQPLLSSSHLGYGSGSLQRDSDEIDMLIRYMAQTRGEEAKFVILGHSTGCQDAVWHCCRGKEANRLCGIILQAPVSDRESSGGKPEVAKNVARAQELVDAGKGECLMPHDVDMAPMTAYRYLSLNGVKGDDDMFSSDFTDEELKERLGHVKVPCLIAYSMADEYVPASIDKAKVSERMAAQMADATVLLVPDGDHSLYKGTDVFLQSVEAFLSKIGAN